MFLFIVIKEYVTPHKCSPFYFSDTFSYLVNKKHLNTLAMLLTYHLQQSKYCMFKFLVKFFQICCVLSALGIFFYSTIQLRLSLCVSVLP